MKIELDVSKAAARQIEQAMKRRANKLHEANQEELAFELLSKATQIDHEIAAANE